jgi:hypothetical protein
MGDIVSEPQTDLAQQTYTIGGTAYRLEPQSWKQAKWLGDTIFKDRDIRTIDYGTIHDCGRAQGPLFMAIALLAEGQTREQKSVMPWSAIEALAQEFQAWLSGWEVATFCTHFFYACRPDQMVMLIPGRVLQDELLKLASLPAPGPSGSSGPSSPSPMAMSPNSDVSAPSSDPLIQIRSSSAVLNVAPSIAPSLVSAGSNSPG